MFGGAERFKYRSVAERYRHRPPYSREVYETLSGLIRDEPRVVLDVGCGDGKLARGLVDSADRVDAVDFSEEMICVARRSPGGSDPRIRWITGAIETVPLDPSYALIVSGASFQWFDQDCVLARFAQVLTERGVLAVLSGDSPWMSPWRDEEDELMQDFVTRMEGHRPVWDSRTLEEQRFVNHTKFACEGEVVTSPTLVEQAVEDYVACQHSRQTWCLEVMGQRLLDEFDEALRGIVSRFAVGGWLKFEVRTRIEWGRPFA